jgi:hypothetical protein
MTVIWCNDFSDDTYTDASIEDLRQFIAVPLGVGKSIQSVFPAGTRVVIRGSNAPTDYFQAGPMSLVSSRLRSVLDDEGVNAEYIQTPIVSANGDVLSGRFYCFNLLEAVDCFDRAKSDFTPRKGLATRIQRVALRPLSAEPPVYLAANTSPALVCTREDVAKAIIDAGCSGATFKSASAWRSPMNPG